MRKFWRARLINFLSVISTTFLFFHPTLAESRPKPHDQDSLVSFMRYQLLEGARPMISAHRAGVSGNYPENGLSSMYRVADGGFQMIEVDVRSTADGKLVLLHDQSLDRTTTCRGRLKDRFYNELQQCRLITPRGTITNDYVPTLRETLQWIRGRGILSIDVKEGQFDEIAEMIAEEQAHGSAIVITYNLTDAKDIHRRHPDLVLSTSIRESSDTSMIDTSLRSRLPAVWLGIGLPDQNLIRLATREGLVPMAATFRTADLGRGASFAEFLDLGVRILATNRPTTAMKAIQNWTQTGS